MQVPEEIGGIVAEFVPEPARQKPEKSGVKPYGQRPSHTGRLIHPVTSVSGRSRRLRAALVSSARRVASSLATSRPNGVMR